MVRHAIATWVWLLGSVGAASFASAQEPASGGAASRAITSVEGLTVIAPKKYETPHVQALNFVRSHGAPTRMLGQLARWTDPICPVTMGLSPEMNAYVSARVAAIATEIGARKSKQPRCKPNVEILFTDDPQVLVDKIARRQSAFLGYHEASEAGVATKVGHPIQAWYLTGVQNDEGQRSVDVSSGAMASEQEVTQTNGGLQAMEKLSRSPPGCPNSHFTNCRSGLFLNVLIVADAKALDGRPIGPIADYIGLLALSQSRSLDECDALPSILDLLSNGCGDRSKPDGLTDADIAYLEALYRTNLDTDLSVEKNQIADNMARSAESLPSK
jgi:hypothetical protein